ncbi:MAG TPA: hypothetical protein PKN80_05465 [bacterium]|nr:hypothetical protein [bacterium]HNS49332.1 hypothetical protein [bacterium]
MKKAANSGGIFDTTTVDSFPGKPGWAAARRRWLAYWEGSEVDRPLLDVRAPVDSGRPPLEAPANLEDRYFDPDYVGRKWLRTVQGTYWAGESVPTDSILMGCYALGCGPKVVFAPNTVWHPVIESGPEAPLAWSPGEGDPWRRKLDRVILHLLELGRNRFLVGEHSQVPPNDLLMLLRGTEPFLMELVEAPERWQRRLDEVMPVWLELLNHFRGLIAGYQKGCFWGWPGLWHPDYVLLTQSDMSALISPALFEKWVLREMDWMGERFNTLWYHLDGPRAVVHLPALLSRPYLKVIQFVPGAGVAPNGPAYLELYRRVQAAGRGLDLHCPPAEAEFLVRRLRPERLLLRVVTESPEAADEFVEKARRWCGSHLGRD